jgi:hypothetical protein
MHETSPVTVMEIAKAAFSLRWKGLDGSAFSSRFLPDQKVSRSTFLHAVT